MNGWLVVALVAAAGACWFAAAAAIALPVGRLLARSSAHHPPAPARPAGEDPPCTDRS